MKGEIITDWRRDDKKLKTIWEKGGMEEEIIAVWRRDD